METIDIQNDDIKIEFDLVKNCVIYIDWNILSYLSGISSIPIELFNKAICFKHILDNELDTTRYCLPYSYFHYRDIILGSSEYFNQKRSFLHSITKGWKISEDINNNNIVRLDKCLNEEEDFNTYRKNNSFSDTPLELPKYVLKAIAESTILSVDNNELKNEILKIITDDSIPAGLSIFRLNKKLRNTKIKYEGKIFKYPSLSKKMVEQTDDLNGIVNEVLKKSALDFELIKEITNKNLEIAKPYLSKFTNEIIQLGFLCEALGICSEDLSKITAFDGIINDISHLSFGLRSHIFITQDKALRVKAEFIKKWNKLSVRIFDMDSFICAVLKQKMSEIDSNRMPGSQTINFILDDKIIGEYIV